MLNYFQRSPEDTNTLRPSLNNEGEREKGEGASDGGRDADGEENREGSRGEEVNLKRVKMRCTGCFTERTEEDYINTTAA